MKIIFTVLLVFYALLLLTRFIGPILLQYFLKKLSKKFDMSQQTRNKSKKNPFINIGKSKKTNPPAGEYIDFEEVD